MSERTGFSSQTVRGSHLYLDAGVFSYFRCPKANRARLNKFVLPNSFHPDIVAYHPALDILDGHRQFIEMFYTSTVLRLQADRGGLLKDAQNSPHAYIAWRYCCDHINSFLLLLCYFPVISEQFDLDKKSAPVGDC